MSSNSGDLIEWNHDKNLHLKETRDICFEDVLAAIQNDALVGDIRSDMPGRDNQRLLLVKLSGYIHVVPYVKTPRGKFLKTIYPSRKFNSVYGEKNEQI